MIFGYPPFHGENDSEIFKKIVAGFQPITQKGYKAHFPSTIPCSDAAKDFLSKLLTSDTAKRLTAEEALEHPWLTGIAASDKPMLDDVLKNLRSFSASCRFKQAILELMSDKLSENDLQHLRKAFEELDENKVKIIEIKY